MAGLFTWLGSLLLMIWDKFRNFLYWYYLAIAAFGYAVYKGIALIGDMSVRVVQYVVALFSYVAGNGSVGCAPGGLGEALAICNTFLPLDEFFHLTAALLIAVWLPIGLYRFVKSLIPELFGFSLGHE